MMEKKTYGFAIIGCGVIANIHAAAIARVENAKLIGVYDFSLERAKEFADKYGCKTYAKQEELLEDPEIDVVNICTPSGLHCKQIIACAKAKKNIIVEKPMAITKEQLSDVIFAVEKNNVKLEVISQLRFTNAIRTLKSAIDEGKLGKIYIADYKMKYYRSPEYYASSNWRGTWSMDGGGALMNQGIHGIDLIQYVMGGIKSVFADCKTLGRDIEVEDTANVCVEYNLGAVGVIECTVLAKPGYERKIEIHAEKGSVVITEDSITTWDVEGVEKPELLDSKMDARNVISFNEDYHIEQIKDLVDAVENDRRPFIDVYEGKKVVDVILASYESAQIGKRVYL